MEGMSDSTRAFLKAFLFCALAAAILTAIFSGVVPGDISKAITFGALAVVVLATILGLSARSRRSG